MLICEEKSRKPWVICAYASANTLLCGRALGGRFVFQLVHPEAVRDIMITAIWPTGAFERSSVVSSKTPIADIMSCDCTLRVAHNFLAAAVIVTLQVAMYLVVHTFEWVGANAFIRAVPPLPICSFTPFFLSA
jgi:hypothetical protein